MASSVFSVIRRRARSTRARRSSLVIGLAWSRIDASAVMLGGNGPVWLPPRPPRCAERRMVGNTAPAAPASERNVRRVSMDLPYQIQDRFRRDVGAVDARAV